MLVKQSESRSLDVKNRTIDGFSFKLVLAKTEAGDPVSAGAVALQEIILEGVLRRNNKQFTLFSDNLKVLAMESGYIDSTFQFATGSSIDLGSTALVPLMVDLGVLNLRREDEFKLKVTMGQSVFDADANVSPASCFLEFDANEAIGYEWEVPSIRSISIAPGEQRVQEDLGDNVKSICFLNFNKTGVSTSDQVINLVHVAADKWNMNDNYVELLTKRANQFESRTEEATRRQTFCLTSGVDISGVTVDMTLNPSNVQSGQNYLVYRTGYRSARTIALAEVTQTIHTLKESQRLGLGGDPASLSKLRSQKSKLLRFSR